MQLTYSDLEMLAAEAAKADRAPNMPLVGFIVGIGIAVVLWTCIGGIAWNLIA